MTRVRTAIIIGGGIAGPAAAMALQKAGIDPVIYEARPSGADGAGAFLTLAPNGADALRAIDADTSALAAGFPTPAIVLRSGTGKYLGSGPTGPRDGMPSQTLKRAGLYQALHAEAARRGVRIERGKRLVDAKQAGDEVRAVFADGSEATGDVLIGCDGVHSTLRRIIDPAAPSPSYAGLINTGGYASGVPVAAAPGGYEMIFGKRAFFGYTVAPGGDVWWFANVPRRAEPSRDELTAITGDQWRRQLAGLCATDAGPAVTLIEATPDLMAVSLIHTMPRLPAWHAGRMIVIGDAAHAPSPTSGQGASLSIEDAVVLALCLRDLPGHEQAFTRFETVRRPRVERIVKAAARINNSKAAGPVARRVRDAILPLVFKAAANSKQVTRPFEHHIDWAAPVSRQGAGLGSG
jgi:2-polyprenyl-6-methoxyphenol hydroxylase-like FAD-dependent oxidoreductase